MADEYSLKWNKHQKTVINCLSSLRQTCSFVDVTLHTADGHTFSGHKVVLSACSSFFENVFRMHPSEKVAVFLKDISHTDLRYIMEFVYSGEISVSRLSLPSLLDAAEALGIKGLCRTADESDPSQNLQESTEVDPLPKKKRFKPEGKPESAGEQIPVDLLTVSPSFGGLEESGLTNLKSEPVDVNVNGLGEKALTHEGLLLPSDASEESMNADTGDVAVEVFENEGFSSDYKPEFSSIKQENPPASPPSQILSALLRRPTGNESKNEDHELDPEEVAVPLANGEIRCRECERNFENMYKFKRHVKSTHGGRNFQCKFCNRKFKLRHHVRDHMIRSHSVIE